MSLKTTPLRVREEMQMISEDRVDPGQNPFRSAYWCFRSSELAHNPKATPKGSLARALSLIRLNHPDFTPELDEPLLKYLA